ncbi:MAG: bifunctional hydroxymethylpyrimidine kinase/phosphomethylpyrimidine kinase, partial [Alphaproteobacteria bacterium]
AESGDALLDPGAMESLARRLLPKATLLTPNAPEAECLIGDTVSDVEGMMRAAKRLLDMGAGAVLVKGGHLSGATVVDVLATGDAVETFESPRIDTPHTHGTGCTLASAIATGLGQGLDLRTAVGRARAYLYEAIRTAPGLGGGHGPVNHGHTVQPFSAPDR